VDVTFASAAVSRTVGLARRDWVRDLIGSLVYQIRSLRMAVASFTHDGSTH